MCTVQRWIAIFGQCRRSASGIPGLPSITARDGARSHATGTYWPNGTSYTVEGNLEADTAAVKLPEPNVMVQALAKGGVPASMRTYTVAADGKTMTETVVFFTPDGKPVMRTNYFNRVK